MLKLSGVTKSFGGRTVLDGVSFVVNAGEVAGLVAPSGAGKTTLLRIIVGEERPDSGSAVHPGGAHLGYLRQGHAGAAGRPALEIFPAVFAASGEDEVSDLARRMADTSDPEESAALEAAYAAALERLATAIPVDGMLAAWRDLGLRPVAPEEPVGSLSGGEQTKLGLLDLLAARPDILLLDEPTNNLDIAGLAWLDRYLDGFAGAVIIVSHDRAVLDGHATQIIELDPVSGRAESFPGDYTAYAEEKARRNAEQWQRYQRQQRHEREVQQAIHDLKGRAQRTENTTIHFHYRKRALKVARRAVTLQRRLEREIDSVEHIDKPVRQPHRVRAAIQEGARAGGQMLAAEGLTLTAGGRTLLQDFDFTIGWGERVVLVGPNGGGKTTLLRTLLGEQPPADGRVRISPGAKPGYLPQRTDEGLVERGEAGRTPLEVIRNAAPLDEGQARRFLHRFLFTTDQVFTPLAKLSYGERRRLHLATLVGMGANLLVLDEPTNHLDVGAREAFESALEDFEGALLVVTHDRYFIECFADRVIEIGE